jgi:hypothetical protein
LKTPEELEKPQSQCIPTNTTWIKSNANQVEPEKNLVQLEDGRKVFRDLNNSKKKSNFIFLHRSRMII